MPARPHRGLDDRLHHAQDLGPVHHPQGEALSHLVPPLSPPCRPSPRDRLSLHRPARRSPGRTAAALPAAEHTPHRLTAANRRGISSSCSRGRCTCSRRSPTESQLEVGGLCSNKERFVKRCGAALCCVLCRILCCILCNTLCRHTLGTHTNTTPGPTTHKHRPSRRERQQRQSEASAGYQEGECDDGL